MQIRSTQEVFEDHLDLAQKGDVKTDLRRNFSEDCVLLTGYGVFSGLDGARKAADLLDEQIGKTRYEYRTRLWHGELAFLEWTADTDRARIDDGADSYWIKDGRIRVMTIHYTVQEKP